MSERVDRELVRLLAGELGDDEAAALERRIAADPELTERCRRLHDTWEGLEPPPWPAAPSLAPELRRRLAAEPASLAPPPWWARGVAAAALAAGMAIGIVIGGWQAPNGVPAAAPAPAPDLYAGLYDETTLAESYWELWQSDEATTGDPAAAGQSDEEER